MLSETDYAKEFNKVLNKHMNTALNDFYRNNLDFQKK